MSGSLNQSIPERGSTGAFAGGAATAVAHANIALSKYWGKSDAEAMLAAVPSLSMTLEALSTRTAVQFDSKLDQDEVWLDGAPASEKVRMRASLLLGRVRAISGLKEFAKVQSRNNFPTAAGLASSASGFAALACAALAAAGSEYSAADISSLARQSSISAARSAFGGFVTLGAQSTVAEPLPHVMNGSQLFMVIALTARGEKSVGSSEGMVLTQNTSPYYSAWCSSAPAIFEEIRSSLLEGDLERAGAAMEHSTLLMHACMMASKPGLLYWNPSTIRVMQRVKQLRHEGLPAFFTMDAGSHVKVLTLAKYASELHRELKCISGVEGTILSGVGEGARLVEPV